MRLPFHKLEGLGNCYIFARAHNIGRTALPELARAISDPATGIGADGLIVVDTRKEPFEMEIYNRDGSQAELCGNGLRQAALYVRKVGFPGRKKFAMRTIAGNFQTSILSSANNHALIGTTLGTPDFSSRAVGMKLGPSLAFDIKLRLGKKKTIKADCVSMGNSHAVIWVDSFDFNWREIGKQVSTHPDFPRGINVHFCRIENSRRFQMRIYERGSGETLACGSGAAACFAAGVMRNYLNKKATAEMPGGKLKLSWDFIEGQIYQEGPVSIICSGEYFFE